MQFKSGSVPFAPGGSIVRKDSRTTESFNLICPDYTRDVKIRDIESKLVELQLDKWETEAKPRKAGHHEFPGRPAAEAARLRVSSPKISEWT